MGGVSANPPAGAQPFSESNARASAEREPFLVYRDGGGNEQVWPFEPGTTQVSVGRLGSSDLLLDWDDRVSRAHARFERSGEDWIVVDDGSRNGTFVNGERLSGRRRLRDGDTLRFGNTAVIFRWGGGDEQPGVAREAPSPVDLSTTQRRVLAALYRPFRGGNMFATSATIQEIADGLFLSPAQVRKHLAVLFAKFGVDKLPEDERLVRLVERALSRGAISDRDL